jgi:hypothetical protein
VRDGHPLSRRAAHAGGHFVQTDAARERRIHPALQSAARPGGALAAGALQSDPSGSTTRDQEWEILPQPPSSRPRPACDGERPGFARTEHTATRYVWRVKVGCEHVPRRGRSHRATTDRLASKSQANETRVLVSWCLGVLVSWTRTPPMPPQPGVRAPQWRDRWRLHLVCSLSPSPSPRAPLRQNPRDSDKERVRILTQVVGRATYARSRCRSARTDGKLVNPEPSVGRGDDHHLSLVT